MIRKLTKHIAVKTIVGVIALLTVFSVIISIMGFSSFTDALLQQYADGAFLTAQSASRFVNGNQINNYAKKGTAAVGYSETLNRLNQLCNSTGSTFIYVIQPDRSDYGHITFIFSAIQQDSKYTHYEFGYVRETTNDDYRHKYRRICEEGSQQELVVRDKGYIETDPHITAMIPVKNEAGEVRAILCVQRQMDVLAGRRNAYIHRLILALALLAMMIIAALSVLLSQMLLKPLVQITEEAARFSKENVIADEKLHSKITSNDEIGQLALSIDQMEEQIQEYIDHITRATAEKERIITELGLARRIQASMLPDTFPPFPDRSEFSVYASMDPAREVGGDFYDFYMPDDDHLCMVIADVSGKGVPAALFMMATKIILANNALNGKTPAQTIKDANTAICLHNSEEMFVTVWLGILQISTGRLMAVNAGHEYPLIRQAGGNFEIFKDKHGFVVGGMEGIDYKEYELQLTPGSMIFLYTDGIPEATDADSNMFGMERMLQALNAESGNTDPEQALKAVREAVDIFVKDAEQFDDMTMLCLTYKGSGSSDNKPPQDQQESGTPRRS